MLTADITTMRVARYHEQGGRCLYCRNLMWERTIEPRRPAMFRVWPWRPGEIIEFNRFLIEQLCTAEHIVRVVDGGSDNITNIAAVCRRCNSSRQTKPPTELVDTCRDISRKDDRFVRRYRAKVDCKEMRRWSYENLSHGCFVRQETAFYSPDGGALSYHEECMVLFYEVTEDIEHFEAAWRHALFD